MDEILQKLPPQVQQKVNDALNNQNPSLACSTLLQNGLIEDAVAMCRLYADFSNFADNALQIHPAESPRKTIQKWNTPQKLADTMIQRGEFQQAAELLTLQQLYEKAAKSFYKQQQFEKAAPLFERIGQFANAIMCYQKAGNVAKQLELQIQVFENEIVLNDGKISEASPARSIAIEAAKSYLMTPETQSIGLELLKKANALIQVADDFEQQSMYAEAAICYEKNASLEMALRAYTNADDFDNAIRICNLIQDDMLEIDTLTHFKKFYLLGQKYLSLNQNSQALAAFKEVPQDSPDYVSALEQQGDICALAQDYTDALWFFETLLKLDLSDDRLCKIAYKAGNCYEYLSDFDNALAKYQKVYSLDKNYNNIQACIHAISEKLHLTRMPALDSFSYSPQGSQIAPPNTNTPPMTEATPPMPIVSAGQGQRIPMSNRNAIPTVKIGETEILAIGSERYEVIEEIAHGGMGVVYKAMDTILERTVALKVLSNSLRDNSVALDYFMREARASARLQHANIVTVYDIGSLNDGTVYMAMEFIDGKNLKQLLAQNGTFTTKFLVQIAIHACRGLQYAHDNGIIHRDVKSSNLMIDKRDKSLKICDLGLAKFASEDRNSTQAVGTPYYMSPEQVLGNEIDRRSDIYSLGVTMFELSTGSLPFLTGDIPYKHVHETPPTPSSINPNIDPTLESIILKMMQKAPADRFKSCNDVVASLKTIQY